MANRWGKRPTKPTPMYSTRTWQKVREHWIQRGYPQCQAEQCLMPGVPIDYTKPHTKPQSFSCGHIVAVYQAEAMGWTVDRIWSVPNTRPEHRRCNVVHGAKLGNRIQRSRAEAARIRRW